MSSKKTKTWPVSTPPNTPGGESKTHDLFFDTDYISGLVTLCNSHPLCTVFEDNMDLNSFLHHFRENPEILIQYFHCVYFLTLARDRRSVDHCQQSLISAGDMCFVELHCFMKCNPEKEDPGSKHSTEHYWHYCIVRIQNSTCKMKLSF